MVGTARAVLAVLLYACVTACALQTVYSLQLNRREHWQGRKILQLDRFNDGAHAGYSIRGRGRDVRLAKKPDANMLKMQVAADQAGGAVDLAGVGLGMKSRVARYQERAAKRRDAADETSEIARTPSDDEGPHQAVGDASGTDSQPALKEDDLLALDKDQDADDSSPTATAEAGGIRAPVATTTDLATTRPHVPPVRVGAIAEDADAGVSDLTALDQDRGDDDINSLPDTPRTTTTPHTPSAADGAVASPPATTTFTQRFETADDGGAEREAGGANTASGTGAPSASGAGGERESAVDAAQRDEEHEEKFDADATLTASQRNTGDPDDSSEERFDAAAALPASQRSAVTDAVSLTERGTEGGLPGIPLHGAQDAPHPRITTTTTTHPADPAALIQGSDAQPRDAAERLVTGQAANSDAALVIDDIIVKPSEVVALQDGTTEGVEKTLRETPGGAAALEVSVVDPAGDQPTASAQAAQPSGTAPTLESGSAAGSDLVVQPSNVPLLRDDSVQVDGTTRVAPEALKGAEGDRRDVDKLGAAKYGADEGVKMLESQQLRGAASSVTVGNARNSITGIDALSTSLQNPKPTLTVQPLPTSSFLSTPSQHQEGQASEQATHDTAQGSTDSALGRSDQQLDASVPQPEDAEMESLQLVDEGRLLNGLASTDEELDAASESNDVPSD